MNHLKINSRGQPDTAHYRGRYCKSVNNLPLAIHKILRPIKIYKKKRLYGQTQNSSENLKYLEKKFKGYMCG